MMRIVGLALELNHQLRKHQWMGIPLDRWIAILLVLLAGLMAIRWLPGGQRGIVVCGVLLLLILVVQSWAARQNYVAFRLEAGPVRHDPSAPMLEPMDKRLLRATGLFEVEGKEQRYTELLAYFRSFETREHAVMAIVPPSAFLLFGRWPGHELGMWYMFFKNRELRRIEPGLLYFGTKCRLALRLDVEQELQPETSPLDVWGGYRSGKKRRIKTRRQVIYLTFDNEDERRLVLADLVADAQNLRQA